VAIVALTSFDANQITDCLCKGFVIEGPALDRYGNWQLTVMRRADMAKITCNVAIA
jgi:hypothetical protein